MNINIAVNVTLQVQIDLVPITLLSRSYDGKGYLRHFLIPLDIEKVLSIVVAFFFKLD
jgi:hypothetical protein